jgi:octaprenyl-diphosphate synthase
MIARRPELEYVRQLRAVEAEFVREPLTSAHALAKVAPLATPSSTALDGIIAFLRDDLEQVERVMREGMASVAPVIPAIGDHTFGSGGKRIRPVMVLLAARLCGYRGPRAIQIAVAAEYLHSASLLHDDVVDGAETRRGRPSVNARFGSKLAILVGDFLYARTCQTLVEDGDPDILASFSESIRAMAEGEVLQLTRSFDPNLSESTYLEVIGGKTSSLLAAAAEAGAILGGVTRAERRAVRDYGWQLGLAFQLVDDALDYSGTERDLGKAPFTDAREGKLTLPLIATLKRCSTGERDAIVALLKSFALQSAAGREPDPAEVARVGECVRRHHGAETALARATQLCANARARIEPFVDCEAKRAMLALADFIVERHG